MARLVPSDLTRFALSGAHSPEIETLRLRVLATAGNGKTLVAAHFYSQCQTRGAGR